MNHDRITLYLRILFVLLGTLAAVLSLKTYISDSEFWAITYSAKLGESGASASVYMKFLFYALLKPIYFLPLDSISHVLVARLEFAALGALTAYVFYRVARAASEDDLAGLVLTLVLVSCSFFLSQSFRVRSDNLSSLFTLLALWTVITGAKRRDGKWITTSFAICGLNLLLLLSTPKSFYFLIVGAGFMALLPTPALDRKRKVLSVILAFVIPPCLLASAFQFSNFAPALRWIKGASLVALEYYSDSFSGLSGPGTYLNSADFVHVLNLIKQNPIHDLFFIVSVVLWFRHRHSMTRERCAYLSLFVVSVLLLVFHNQKLPFFIFALLPILILGAGFAWRDEFLLLRTRCSFNIGLGVLVAITIFSTAAVGLHSTISNSNDQQLAALQPLQAFIKEERVTKYYDAIGLFPRLNKIYAFPSPSDSNNSVIMKVVAHSKPDFLMYVTRELELEPALGFFLGESYVDIGGGAWVRAVTPKALATRMKRSTTGLCQLSSVDLRSLVLSKFGNAIESVHLSEFDASGFVKIERDNIQINSDKGLDWKCEKRDFALTKLRPRKLRLVTDLRFLFGFDSIY